MRRGTYPSAYQKQTRFPDLVRSAECGEKGVVVRVQHLPETLSTLGAPRPRVRRRVPEECGWAEAAEREQYDVVRALRS